MLGVLKAGGAFVPLDPTHPTARLQALVKTVQARIMLCSSNHSEYLKQIVDILIPLSDDSLRELSVHYRGAGPLPGVKSDNAAYVIFTSGSTGEPKVLLAKLIDLICPVANLYRVFCWSIDRIVPVQSLMPDDLTLYQDHDFCNLQLIPSMLASPRY